MNNDDTGHNPENCAVALTSDGASARDMGA
jgi:hypothetical protein